MPSDVMTLGTYDEVYQGIENLVKHNRFAPCQKSRILGPVLPAEKNCAKEISLLIRSNVVQQRIGIIVHTALFRFQRGVV